MNKIRLTEAELHAIVKESIMQVLSENEENEGFGSFIKGAARKIGGDVKQGAQKVWDAGAQKAKNMRNAVSNYAQSVQAAGQKASNMADAQSAIKTIQDLMQKGILGQRIGNMVIGSLNKYGNQ